MSHGLMHLILYPNLYLNKQQHYPMEKIKIMLRFEEKALIRQRFLEAKTKTAQTGWMLHEWVKEQVMNLKKVLEDDLEKEQQD